MAQHDYVIDNSTGANVRADINSVLQAIASNNSGSSDPSTTVASQFFADTSAGIMKLRNTSNNGFVKLFTLAGGVDVDGDSNFRADVTFSGATTGRNVVFDTSDNALKFADSADARFGSSDDLKIFHNGTRSKIQNQTGDFRINGNDIKLKNFDDDHTYITCVDDGAVELYHDNSLCLATDQNGIHVTTNVHLPDNGVLELGNSSDLLIFHNGSNSIINDQGDGQLQLQVGGSTKFNTQSGGVQFYGSIFADDGNKIQLGNDQDLQIFHESNTNKIVSTASQFSFFTNGNLQIFNENGFANLADFIEGGACNLYFDAVKRFETNSSGCKITGSLTCTGTIFPAVDNTINLGNASFRFGTVFAVNGSINTSDKTEKNTIVETDLGLNFINKLKPISYKWNKDDGKTHYGLIAQDVEETILSLGKTVEDFGAISKEKDSPMGLNYSQIISPLIKAVQELSAKVAALEAA